MSRVPNTSRDTFVATNRYIGSLQQQGAPILDWDLNDHRKQIRWHMLHGNAAIAESGRSVNSSGTKSLEITAATTPGNNLKVKAGYAVVAGRLIKIDSDFEYNDITNYVVVGTVTTVTEIVPAVTYKVTDVEKFLNQNYQLSGCRIKFESGALSGSEFTINSLSGQSISVSGDLSTAVPGDAYRILPPAITTPTIDTTDTFYLVTWFEDISPVEDTDLEDPSFLYQPAHRLQLRACVHKNWAGAQSSDTITGHRVLALASVTRSAGDTTISTGDITNTANFFHTNAAMGTVIDELNTAQADINTLEGQINKFGAFRFEYTFDKDAGLFLDTDYSADDIVTNAAVFFSKENWADPTDPHVVQVTSGTTPSAVPEQSYIAVPDTGGAFYQNDSTVAVDDSHIILAGIYSASTPPYNISRAFPMADRPQQVGFNWSLEPTTPVLSIQPGWAYRMGKLYQSPGILTLDPTDTANWEGVAVPAISNPRCYIYLEDAGLGRIPSVFLSETVPKWNGEHPTIKAFTCGMFYYDTGGLFEQTCANNTVYLGDNAPATSVPGAATSNTILTQIRGCGSVKISVTCTALSIGASVGIFGYDGTHKIGHTMVFRHVDEVQTIEVPQMPYVLAEWVLLGAGDDVDIRIVEYKFDPLYMPDSFNWDA